MYIILSITAAIVLSGIVIFMNQPNFGRKPRGERLERVKKSSNYKDGAFRNLQETPQLTSGKNYVLTFIEIMFRKKERLRPESALPSVKTDLWQLDRNEEVLIWFGHSSYFIQTNGIRILVDPVLCGAASPFSFFNKPFEGSDGYKPEDIPDIDYLIISHDHWDHLDYKTVTALKPRIKKVVCPLGVGEHFEHWGFDKNTLVEMDWNEQTALNNESTLYCLPARHFSGRGLPPNQTLWASFLVQTPTKKIFLSGDGGYGTHFADIGRQFGEIDLAVLENGQYDNSWRHIHLLPSELLKTATDLNAKSLLTVHHSKFAMANHPWDEPLVNISELAEKTPLPIFIPTIGEPVKLECHTPALNNKQRENTDK